MITLFISLIALMIGSFLNVCIYRIPKEESIAFPPSHCQSCQHKLAVNDLLPIASFLFLKGKCRYCRKKISKQYPIVEALTTMTITLLFLHYGLTIVFIKLCLVTFLLIIISFIDLEYMIIPDKLLLIGLAITVVLFPFGDNSIQSSLLGTVIGGGFFYSLTFIKNGEAMGHGDVKMMLWLGFLFGWKQVILIILLSFWIGAFVSVILLFLKRKKTREQIPFGPFISVSAYIVILFGQQIISLYLRYL